MNFLAPLSVDSMGGCVERPVLLSRTQVCLVLLLTGFLAGQERRAEQPSFGSQAPLPALAGAYRSSLPPLRPPVVAPIESLDIRLSSLDSVLLVADVPAETAAEKRPRTQETGKLVRAGVSIRCTWRTSDGQRCYKSSYADGLCHLHQTDPSYRGRYFADLSRRHQTLVVWVGYCRD